MKLVCNFGIVRRIKVRYDVNIALLLLIVLIATYIHYQALIIS